VVERVSKDVMGATHFREIDSWGCSGERRCWEPKASRDGFLGDDANKSSSEEGEQSEVYIMPIDPTCDPPPPTPAPSKEEDDKLGNFLEGKGARRRAATVVEAATFENGLMAAMCTSKDSPNTIEQHATVMSASELHFWGVDMRNACLALQRAPSATVKMAGKGADSLSWIWEDTLHVVALRTPTAKSEGGISCWPTLEECSAEDDEVISGPKIHHSQDRRPSCCSDSILGFLKKENSKCSPS